jgi:ABC-type polysaccharide/polyol phosphate export systems, permease component
MTALKELYAYRQMLFSLVKKGLRTRYKGSVLGFLWTFLNPLLQLVVYSIVFSFITRANIDKYYMFLFVALVPWMFFAACLQDSATSIIANKDLVKKIYFPRTIIPLAAVCTAFMNMLFTMIVVLITLIFSGIGISKEILTLPILFVIEFLFALGISLIIAGLTVYFRDLEHILGIVIQMWFYFTPILYSEDMIPKQILNIFKLNPMTNIILAYRDVLYYKKFPDIGSTGIAVVIGIATTIIGYLLFQKLQRGFVEEL